MKKAVLFVCSILLITAAIIFLAGKDPNSTIVVDYPADIADTISENHVNSSLLTHVSVHFPAPKAPRLFYEDFEGDIQALWCKYMPDALYSGTISENYAANGSNSYRFELNKSDPIINGNKRSVLKLCSQEGSLEERCYSFSTLLPDGGVEDYAIDPEGSEVIAQWNGTPDPGEEWGYPSLALHTFDGHYYLSRSWDDSEISSNESINAKGYNAEHYLGSYIEDKGKWVHWTFRIKWGWLASHKPRIQVFKNGKQLLDISDPNTTNDKQGVTFNIGIVKWDWAQGINDTSILTQRVIYFDSVSIEGIQRDIMNEWERKYREANTECQVPQLN